MIVCLYIFQNVSQQKKNVDTNWLNTMVWFSHHWLNIRPLQNFGNVYHVSIAVYKMPVGINAIFVYSLGGLYE